MVIRSPDPFSPPLFYLANPGIWNYTSYVYDPGQGMTLEECQQYCEETIINVNYMSNVNDRCYGIIVDELFPGKCWIPSGLLPTYDVFWGNISAEIGNCGNGSNGFCGPCNTDYRLKYWNLTTRAGKMF